MQEYRYVVVAAGSVVNDFVTNDPLGQFMFNGDGSWAGGRVLNCKSIAGEPTRHDGYALSENMFVFLNPMIGEEYDEIMRKGFDVIADYDNSIEFLQNYPTC